MITDYSQTKSRSTTASRSTERATPCIAAMACRDEPESETAASATAGEKMMLVLVALPRSVVVGYVEGGVSFDVEKLGRS